MKRKIPVWKQAYAGSHMARISISADGSDSLLRALSNVAIGTLSSPCRVLVFTNHSDATVEISFVHPARTQSDVCLAVFDEDRHNELGDDGLGILFEIVRPTHVIFCRYWGRHFDLIRQLADQHGAATLGFLDDNLLEVPAEIGANTYDYFLDASRRETILRTLVECHLFVFSTPYLARAMEKYRAGPVAEWPISRSANEADLISSKPRRITPTIGYMGSSSHASDLNDVAPALIKLLKKRPEVRLEFFGTIQPPPGLLTFGDRVTIHPKAFSYDDFIDRLKRLGWWVGLAPLTDSPFNFTKTPTKWVEYTLAGIPTLANSVVVYGKPAEHGALRLVKPESYLEAIEALLDDEAGREAMITAARKLLLEAYNRSDHGQFLKQALETATLLARSSFDDGRNDQVQKTLAINNAV